MFRKRVSRLEERVAALEEQVEALTSEEVAEVSAPEVQYVLELRNPKPISKPLDFDQLMSRGTDPLVAYYEDEEDEDWRFGVYL